VQLSCCYWSLDLVLVLLPLHVHLLLVLQVHLMVLLSVHLLLCCQVCHGIPARLLLVLCGIATHVAAITLIHRWLCLGHHSTRVRPQQVALVMLHASQRLLSQGSEGRAAATCARCCCNHAVVPAHVAHHLLVLSGCQQRGQAWDASACHVAARGCSIAGAAVATCCLAPECRGALIQDVQSMALHQQASVVGKHWCAVVAACWRPHAAD
jgi:hypothetical protein